tara:strand:- start:405 stop:3326 length:2922 start_codon:yes stop_codon:yes gene_type:complete
VFLQEQLTRELKSLYELPAENLINAVNLRLSGRGHDEATSREIADLLVVQDSNSPAVAAFHVALPFWDAQPDLRFTGASGSAERRREVLSVLGLDAFSDEINDAYPVPGARHYVISSDQQWNQWYLPSMGNKFYWNNYKKTLLAKGYESDEVEGLSASVDDIMRRISSPFSEDPYQSKGLVVGHVQSGKTSHFTGVIAKAISSGYKLVIVLTGTVELLRAQTQRRLDMELIGKENILRGRSEADHDLLSDVDYVLNDPDWDNFVHFDKDIAEDPKIPQIFRLTTYKNDFKSLKQGLDALDFQADRKRLGLPIYSPENLEGMPVRLLVLKKNSTTLQKVIKDLKSIHSNLQEVPALIIDDEADQASPNTKKASLKPVAPDEDKKERTAINRHISSLLQLMPRSQYVGYTATPFANVFIEPDDYADIFPKDFIISLVPSRNYLGSSHFHDIEFDLGRDTASMADSNEAAFARRIRAIDEQEEVTELTRTLDAFVLTGAIKLFRASEGAEVDVRHHTMLAHTSIFKNDHRELKMRVDKAWAEGAYHSASTIQRLWDLLQEDFVALDKARKWGRPFPPDQKSLADWIGEALAKIDTGQSPAVVVNGDEELESRALNFKERDEWRVVIGGAKLSRGFTVEGLTISYFRRKSSTQDALLQMGRWFGYRPGYGDLVRLFIGENERHNSRDIDLYDAFTSTIRDEEEFRAQLKNYAELSNEDGSPMVTPAEMPPLVYQHLPWLKPTSRNKMYNAALTIEGHSEKFIEKARHAPYDPAFAQSNFQLFQTLILPHLGNHGEFTNADGRPISTLYGVLPASSIREFVSEFRYAGDTLKPTANFIDASIKNGSIEDFFVMLHLPKDPSIKYLPLSGTRHELPVIKRTRRNTSGSPFTGTEKNNREPLLAVSGPDVDRNDQLARSLRTATRASMLIEIVGEEPFWQKDLDHKFLDSRLLAVLFGFVFPFGSAPNKGRVVFQAGQST